jgi:hypothetical protein
MALLSISVRTKIEHILSYKADIFEVSSCNFFEVYLSYFTGIFTGVGETGTGTQKPVNGSLLTPIPVTVF